MIESYIIIQESLENLSKKIEMAISEGWQPYGSPFTRDKNICQAMIKHPPAKNSYPFINIKNANRGFDDSRTAS